MPPFTLNRRGRYVGECREHTGHTALIRPMGNDPPFSELWEVQFDALTHPLSHGWYPFPKREWHLLPVEDGYP